jgi:hypothetical protein
LKALELQPVAGQSYGAGCVWVAAVENRVMRDRFLGVAIVIVILGVCAPALGDPLPKRRPGLWEMSINSPDAGRTHTSKQCVDETTDAKLQSMMNNGPAQGVCSKNEFTRTSTGFESHAECAIGSSKMTSVGAFTGDFDSAYTGTVVTSFDPPLIGKGSSSVSISAKWVGACPSDMKPGDMVTDRGKVDMNKAAAGMKQAQEMMKNPEIAKMMRDGFQRMNGAAGSGE